MASICVHRAPRTPLDIAPGHIRSRGDLLEDHRPATDLPHKAVRARLVPSPPLFCNSSGTAIAILGASRAHPPARWHRFVSIERREPLQTSLQGTSARAMISRKNPDLPHTAVRARSLVFLQFICHGNRHSTGLQGTSARAMASICVHRATQTPPDSTPGHIGSRDDFQEFGRPATHGPQSPVPHFPAIHLARQSPFHGPPEHIPVPGGTKLGSPGPFSGANCLIINNGRCQVNFTKARFDSIRPGRHSVLLILPENLGKSPQPGTSTGTPQRSHLNHDTSTRPPQLKLCKIWIAKWC